MADHTQEHRMSNAQQHALRILADAPLDEFAVTIHRIRRDILRRLCDAGLARWRPYSRPVPSWQITPAGRNALGAMVPTERERR
jgi:hypothetical protein